ncbi:MAG TPA: carbon-nitrogen hydrolase family protein [Candidatus Polarisedimenticolaceae bacterium]|nr:carbon-nitrogen hydrolase family protein [Candidatus Polarisedimenticolaceae bacterium]
MTRPLRLAAVQMRSTGDRERNLRLAAGHARRAADEGAELIAFPENVAYLRPEGVTRPPAEDLDGPTAEHFREIAVRHRAWVLAGTLAERIPRSRRVHNTSVLFRADGTVAAVYRKVHLFDVAIPGRASYRESRFVEPGARAVVAASPWGILGLSICYDLRFPEIYRALAFSGAEILLVPSAFTAYTGRAHWTVLLRARAIENQAWVVAPAQWGHHHGTRRSFGHTSIVDPWGDVVACRERGTGIVVATIVPGRADRVREELPSLALARARYGERLANPSRAGPKSGSRARASR